MVFCIDTRSELIRRHVENKGHYETLDTGFGIAMDYEDLKMDLRKSCPPILNSAYHVSEVPQERHTEKVKAYSKKMPFQTLRNFKKNENMLLRPLDM
jgi:uncharacterized protein YbcC (UPF0753/DUF2309 family)